MNEKYTAKVSIDIEAPPGKVWDALTDPQLIKKYFFGTEAVSEWKVGSTLEFKGVWEGKEYLDKGTILELIPRKLLRYTYLSSFSGLPDTPDNYANVTYYLAAERKIVTLTVTQDNIATEEAKQHSEKNWMTVLEGLRDLVEG